LEKFTQLNLFILCRTFTKVKMHEICQNYSSKVLVTFKNCTPDFGEGGNF